MSKDNSHLLGSSFVCSCGKEHEVPTRHLLYGENSYDLLRRTVDEIAPGAKVLVIADRRTYEAAGREVVDALPQSVSSVYIVEDSDDESPVADDVTKDRILEEAPVADVYIAVGSGVINDLVKWVAFLRKRPYITIPTAASMNGYGSANVAAAINGLKVLFHADACKAVHVDPRVLVNAPFRLTTSGLGDVLAKSVSSADWRINKLLFGEYYCQFSVDLLKDLEPVYLNNPDGIKNKDPLAIRALFEALFYSSVAMTITGTSSPASGGEHLISHTLDMVALRDQGKHDLHGRQVGVASILMAALYERVMGIEKPVFHDPPESIGSSFWGSLSVVVEEEYAKKKTAFEKARAYLSYQQNWQDLQKTIKPALVKPERLKNCLAKANGAHRFRDIVDNDQPLARDKFLSVVMHANQMRARFTILDLAILLGIFPAEVDDLVNRWVA